MNRFQTYSIFPILIVLLSSAGCSSVVNSVLDISEASIKGARTIMGNSNEDSEENSEEEKLSSEQKARIYGLPKKAGECVKFKEKAIKTYALNQWDENSDGCISAEEAKIATKIPKFAFVGEEIKTITDLNQFPELTVIDEGAFAGITQLEYVRLLYVKQIGKDAFKDCSNLVELHLPNVTQIDGYAFSGTNLKYGVEQTDTIKLGSDKNLELKLGEGAFSAIGSDENNTPVKFQLIGKFDSNLNNHIFSDNKNISEISIKSHEPSVYIPNGMFKNCTSLTRVEVELVLKENQTPYLKFDHDAFTGANKLTKFQCTEYDPNNFENNPNITNILGKPTNGSPNVQNPENVILTIPDSLAAQVDGNHFDDKDWKAVRLRDEKQFQKDKYLISAE